MPAQAREVDRALCVYQYNRWRDTLVRSGQESMMGPRGPLYRDALIKHENIPGAFNCSRHFLIYFFQPDTEGCADYPGNNMA